MAIGAMAAFSSAFMNGTLFHRLKLGDRKSTISVSIDQTLQGIQQLVLLYLSHH
jgi:hypothetical protein